MYNNYLELSAAYPFGIAVRAVVRFEDEETEQTQSISGQITRLRYSSEGNHSIWVQSDEDGREGIASFRDVKIKPAPDCG